MILRVATLTVLGFLALHSFSYGIGFVADPAMGPGEFGEYDEPSEAAENLVRIVGVMQILLGTAAVMAAVLHVRRVPGGGWLTLGLGVALLALGTTWGLVGNAWDAGLYLIAGAALAGLGWMALQSFKPAS